MRKVILSFSLLMTALTCGAQETELKLDTIHYAGDSNIYTDIVFLGDGFTDEEMQVFVDFAKAQSEHFFEKMPWSAYKEMFNVFYVKTPSNESGAGKTPDEPIDNYYGTCFGTSGVDRMPWPTKWASVYGVLNQVKPNYDMVAIVVNSEKYGGGGGGSFICFSLNEHSIETLRHEAGHAFGHLADEYWYRGYEAPNMTSITDPVKWENWMGYNDVGFYCYYENEGDDANSKNWYRPHQNCQMRYLYSEYCPVCMEALIERIHETSRNIVSYTPKNEEATNIYDKSQVFMLKLLKPNPNTLRVDWQIDGKTVAHNKERLTINAGQLPDGDHTLTVIVEDTTLLVRTNDHTTLHASVLAWDIIAKTPLGIKAVGATGNDFTIGPLPFTTELCYNAKESTNEDVRMELWDTDGHCAASATAHGSQCSIATGKLPKGVYVLRIYSGVRQVYCRQVTKH